MLKPLHLSHSCRHGDGGIAFAVSDLLRAQQRVGIYARWLTADQFRPFLRDRQLYQSILDCQPNILHFHGLWRSHTRISHRLIASNFPTLIAPHGMMDDWAMAHSSWKKELVWHLWEKRALHNAVCLHAVCEAEAEAIRARLPGVPVAIIPNGVASNFDQSLNISVNSPWSNSIPSGHKILLFFGRFHQKKGLEPLISAWQSVLDQAKSKSWWLVCVGFGDDGKFQSQLENYPVEQCSVLGPLFGDDKVSAFLNASAFILPSFSEGLPIAALEAMSYGLPCLLSSACNLPEAYHHNAAFLAEPDTTQLISSLSSLFSTSDHDLALMGESGRRLVQEKFDWSTIARKTQDVYQWMLGISDSPECVILPTSGQL